jgi:hypothetical protein
MLEDVFFQFGFQVVPICCTRSFLLGPAILEFLKLARVVSNNTKGNSLLAEEDITRLSCICLA